MKTTIYGIFLIWRRERDLNPRSVSGRQISSLPHSTTLTSLHAFLSISHSKFCCKWFFLLAQTYLSFRAYDVFYFAFIAN